MFGAKSDSEFDSTAIELDAELVRGRARRPS